VVEEYGRASEYIRRAVAQAMKEWIDADDYARVEEQIDRLVQSAERTPEDLSRKKLTTTSFDDNDTHKVQCRVDAELKNEFAEHSRSEADERPGLVLTRALRAYRRGGRSRRVQDKLERVIDDAESLLAEVAATDSLSHQEKKTIAICDQLGEEFTRDELEDAIEIKAGGSDPTIREYTKRVLDRLDHVEHPNAPDGVDLFVPKAEAEKLGGKPDAPALDRFHNAEIEYDGLSRDEKITGLRIAVARRASSSNGYSALCTPAVEKDIFNGHSSSSHARKLIDLAADAGGFKTDTRRNVRRLLVDLSEVNDEAVLSALGDGQGNSNRAQDGLSATPSKSTASENTSNPESRINQLMEASPADNERGSDE
jgi:hypothetical protein